VSKDFVITRVFDADLERKTFEQGRDSMKQGWSGTFEQLESYLSL